MKMLLLSFSALAILSGIISLAADTPSAADRNWPQWRGPLATGAAPTANPPVRWSETTNVKWKTKLPGSGTASPVIWENQIFILTAIPEEKKSDTVEATPAPAPPPADANTDNQPRRRRGGGGFRAQAPIAKNQFALLCLDRQTGKILWQKIARETVPHEGHHQDHGFASHSPVTDGKRIFAYFGSRGLHCYDLQGNLKWQKDFGQMRTKNSFGEGSSPALFGNTVVVNWDHEGEDFIVALDADSGKELWRQPRDEDTSWSTPLIVQHDGKAQVITSATRKIRSYDLVTGKLLWECGGMTANTIPSPVAANGVVFATSGFRGSSLQAIRLGRTGDLTGSDAILWQHNRNTPYVPSPLLYGDKLYLFAGNNNILSCFDTKDGRVLIDGERVEGLQGVYASPVGAGGRVYLVGRNGATVVINNSDKLEVLATNRLAERIDASPAIVGKEIFLRSHGSLYCIEEK